MKQLKFSDLIGKKISAMRGHKYKKTCELKYILFDDGETYIELNEQDPYDYHDCNNSARSICIYSDSDFWNKLNNKENEIDEPTNLSIYPF